MIHPKVRAHINKVIDELKPYEVLVIEPDKNGSVENWYVFKSQKMSVSELGIVEIKPSVAKIVKAI